MPLTTRQQKDLKLFTKGLITEVNEEFGRHNLLDALIYIRKAISNIGEDEFKQEIKDQPEAIREPLTNLRNLFYHTPENIFSSNAENIHANPLEIQTYIQQIISDYELKLRARSPSPFKPEKLQRAVSASPTGEVSEVEFLVNLFGLRPGDIIISEMPFENPKRDDFVNFNGFKPGHTSIWTGDDFDRPIAHAVREGYRPPGLKLSGLWEGRHFIFRYNDPDIADAAGNVMRNWASAEVQYTEEEYKKVYPQSFWQDRHERDLRNYFSNGNGDEKESSSQKKIAGPATPFGEPRASFDLADLSRDKSLAQLKEEGLRRAFKFASRAEVKDAAVSKLGQRCTPIAVAAFQASFLAPLVRPNLTLHFVEETKGKAFLEYADKILIENWRQTELGSKILAAIDKKDFSQLLPEPFNVDQRFATPKPLYEMLLKAKDFTPLGAFSYFNHKLVAVKKPGEELEIYSAPTEFKSLSPK